MLSLESGKKPRRFKNGLRWDTRMTCLHCEKPATRTSKTLGALCESCFCAIIEKRFRKEIAAQGGLPPQGTLILLDDRSVCTAVAASLLRKMLRPPLAFDIRERCENGELAIDPRPLDREAHDALRDALDNAAPRASPTALEPLRSTSTEEIASYAAIHGLSGSVPAQGPLGKALDEFEARYPGSKAGLAQWRKSAEKIRQTGSNA